MIDETSFWLFTAYLVGMLLFAPTMISACDDLHANRDPSRVKAELESILGQYSAGIWIDILGTMALVFWPLTIIGGTIIAIRRNT